MKTFYKSLIVISSIIAASVVSNCAKASDDWTTSEINKEAATMALFAIDYAQTKDIKNHNGLYETNKLLGLHPSDTKIRNYFLGAAIGHVILVNALPSQYREYVQDGTIGLELVVIGNNKRIGLNVKF